MPPSSRRAFLAGFGLVCLPVGAWAAPALQLMAITAADCHESAAFRREVMPHYARTSVGRIAPMLEQPLDGPWPDGLAIGRMPRVTPGFLLLDRGVEIARFEGYATPAAFYGRLQAVLEGAAGRG